MESGVGGWFGVRVLVVVVVLLLAGASLLVESRQPPFNPVQPGAFVADGSYVALGSEGNFSIAGMQFYVSFSDNSFFVTIASDQSWLTDSYSCVEGLQVTNDYGSCKDATITNADCNLFVGNFHLTQGSEYVGQRQVGDISAAVFETHLSNGVASVFWADAQTPIQWVFNSTSGSTITYEFWNFAEVLGLDPRTIEAACITPGQVQAQAELWDWASLVGEMLLEAEVGDRQVQDSRTPSPPELGSYVVNFNATFSGDGNEPSVLLFSRYWTDSELNGRFELGPQVFGQYLVTTSKVFLCDQDRTITATAGSPCLERPIQHQSCLAQANLFSWILLPGVKFEGLQMVDGDACNAWSLSTSSLTQWACFDSYTAEPIRLEVSSGSNSAVYDFWNYASINLDERTWQLQFTPCTNTTAAFSETEENLFVQ